MSELASRGEERTHKCKCLGTCLRWRVCCLWYLSMEVLRRPKPMAASVEVPLGIDRVNGRISMVECAFSTAIGAK